MKHLVVLSDGEVENLINGKQEFIFKFYPKKPDFLAKVSLGDLIFFRKHKGEVLGQFTPGKLVVIENLEASDWKLIARFSNESLNEVTFKTLIKSNNVLVIIKVEKLEQFITSPIENPRGKKEWVVLD